MMPSLRSFFMYLPILLFLNRIFRALWACFTQSLEFGNQIVKVQKWKEKKRTTTDSWTAAAVSLSMTVMSKAALSMAWWSIAVIPLLMILSISGFNHHFLSAYCPDLDVWDRDSERWNVWDSSMPDNAKDNVLKTVKNLVNARAVQKRWRKDQKKE